MQVFINDCNYIYLYFLNVLFRRSTKPIGLVGLLKKFHIRLKKLCRLRTQEPNQIQVVLVLVCNHQCQAAIVIWIKLWNKLIYLAPEIRCVKPAPVDEARDLWRESWLEVSLQGSKCWMTRDVR